MPLISLVLFAIFSITIYFHGTVADGFPPVYRLLANTSVLPPGWSVNPVLDCVGDVFPDSFLGSQLLLGPNFTDPVTLSIESCVNFCNQQGVRLAGLKGTECRCGNFLNSMGGFEGDSGECSSTETNTRCPGNLAEACGNAGGNPALVKLFSTVISPFNCSNIIWPGGAPLSPRGSWRFSYFYNDSFSAQALPHRATEFFSPISQGNLTVEACVNACENEGFKLAGVEFGSECFCGNAIESLSQPITNCSLLPVPDFSSGATPGALLPCTGNDRNFCGGPNIISIFTLPGTALAPMIPFDPDLDDYCTINCPGHT